MSCHVLADRFTFAWEQVSSKVRKQVTIQQVVSREAFWHVFCQTPITEVDFKCVLARNCEGTEQLPYIFKLSKNVVIEPLAVTESV